MNDEIKTSDVKIKSVEKIPEGEMKVSKLVLVTPEDQPNVELGIDAVLAVVDCGAEFKEAYDAAVGDDGKITFGDALKHPVEIIYEPLKAAFNVFNMRGLIIPQALDVEFDEADEIVAKVKERFSVNDEKAKKIIENSFKALYHIKEVISAF